MAPSPVVAPGGAVGGTQPAQLDTEDMQGLVGRAYGHLPFARYMLLGVDDPAAARTWLGALAGDVTSAADHGDSLVGPCLNVAFSAHGLARLGLTPDGLASLPRALQEGMVTEHRARILGDTGASAAEMWRWGGPTNNEIDVVLMVFASTEAALDEACAARRSTFGGDGALSEVGEPIDGRVLDEKGTEHFGFADGLSQPVLKGWPHGTSSQNPPADPQPPKWTEVNPGEIVLGYHDNFDKPSEGPTVAAATDPTNLLPPAAVSAGRRRHLGQNGTYVVVRQLAQDVPAFKQFVASTRPARPTGAAATTPEQLAAKLVGRWANGAPLALAPDSDGQAPPGANDFGFHDVDRDGLRCPPGAHIRRSNPRDTGADNPLKALASTKNHRILRRGRSYGLPIADPPTRPGEEGTAERGLVFICLNADIERQFEFVQHTWLDNPYFGGLYGEVDPIVGTQPSAGGAFTQPNDPIRCRLTGLPNFVTVKGGGYFFLPGIRAIRYLAGLGR